MLRCLLWLNHFIMKLLTNLNKNIEQHLEYKKIKKLIKKKWDCIELLKCRDGIVLLIREDVQNIKVMEWVQKNILSEPYERYLMREIKEGKSNITSKKKNNSLSNMNENSDQPYKVSNLRVVLPKTNETIALSSLTQQKIDTSSIEEDVKKKEGDLNISKNNMHPNELSNRNHFRRM